MHMFRCRSTQGIALVLAVALSTGLAQPADAQSDSMRQLTSSILRGLGATAGTEPTPIPPANADMRLMTDSVLSGLQLAAPEEEVPEGVDGLSTLISQALTQGQSDAYLEALVVEAVNTGRVVVPGSLRTSDGDVDARTLVSAIVAETAAVIDETRPPVNAPEVPLVMVRGQQYYVVQPGDSLGGIAFRIFGRTSAFQDIFQANRESLGSPDRIAPGQRLLIPRI